MKPTGNNKPTSMTLEEIIERVRVMRHQESTSYLYQNYMPCTESFMDTEDNNNNCCDINVVWREKICQWSYNVVDHFDLSREAVAVSLSLFDRFFATLGNKYNGNMALLASLTTLHIAIKLYETKKIKLSTLANLSRGQFTSRDIEVMEWTIMSALQWKLHPPTPYTFVEHILFFLPPEVNSTIRNGLSEVSKYLTELAVCDSYFVDRSDGSAIAFAAILNVMEDMNYSKFPGGSRETFLRNLNFHVDLYHRTDDVVNARRRLRKMFTASSTVHHEAMTPIPTPSTDYNCVTPQEVSPTSPGQENYHEGDDFGSFADRSTGMSSGSILSTLNHNTGHSANSGNSGHKRSSSCANSVDTSKSGSGNNHHRYSQQQQQQKPSPTCRVNFFTSVSPILTSTRAAAVASTMFEGGIR